MTYTDASTRSARDLNQNDHDEGEDRGDKTHRPRPQPPTRPHEVLHIENDRGPDRG